MSADSHHHHISCTLKRLKHIEDFNDFVAAVKSVKENVIEMRISNFRDWQSDISMYQLCKLGDNWPMMTNITELVVYQGSSKLWLHTSLTSY